ncbi:hypothetical protein NDU88_002282 [Pleurodeles waltl]|uniref:Uncharacterized protein n=1 Tax=Pleurodeles waltl TaxID=8319 RepID=A0AAV7VC27_PLEWA|nr:hypothetical protein NDU88_002282 [Pleurodeles waltl]
MASRRMTAQQVVGMLFESQSDHDYETDSASEAEEEVRDSGSDVSVGGESSDDEATLSADEGPVLEEDIDVPIVQQPGAERFPVIRPGAVFILRLRRICVFFFDANSTLN